MRDIAGLGSLALIFGIATTACGASTEEGTEGGSGGCTPGASVTCACSGGMTGEQVCAADGLSFGACSCPGGASPIATPDDTGAGPGSVTDPSPGDITMPGEPTDPADPVMDPGEVTEPTPLEDPTRTDEALAYDDQYGCTIQTGWAGDALCILPPDPSEGFQLHYGPNDYDNPDEIARFVLEPGGEVNDEENLVTGNTTDIIYQHYHIRLRPGTHHMILWGDDSSGAGAGLGGRYIFGAQGALEGGGAEDRPDPNTVAPENLGLGYTMPAQLPVRFNMHYVNTTAEPMLREGWINIHYANPDDVTEIADPITFWGAIGLNIAPQSTQTVGAACDAPASPIRVLGLSGHMHAHGTRFSAWHHSASGTELVYETYDWAEPAEMRYDSVTTNAVAGSEPYVDGGHTGELIVNPGDSISYECEMQNDTDQTLRFGNQTYTAEMCLLFGGYAPSLGGPWSCFSL